jgi:hypothetical protein
MASSRRRRRARRAAETARGEPHSLFTRASSLWRISAAGFYCMIDINPLAIFLAGSGVSPP